MFNQFANHQQEVSIDYKRKLRKFPQQRWKKRVALRATTQIKDQEFPSVTVFYKIEGNPTGQFSKLRLGNAKHTYII